MIQSTSSHVLSSTTLYTVHVWTCIIIYSGTLSVSTLIGKTKHFSPTQYELLLKNRNKTKTRFRVTRRNVGTIHERLKAEIVIPVVISNMPYCHTTLWIRRGEACWTTKPTASTEFYRSISVILLIVFFFTGHTNDLLSGSWNRF